MIIINTHGHFTIALLPLTNIIIIIIAIIIIIIIIIIKNVNNIHDKSNINSRYNMIQVIHRS